MLRTGGGVGSQGIGRTLSGSGATAAGQVVFGWRLKSNLDSALSFITERAEMTGIARVCELAHEFLVRPLAAVEP